MDFYALSISSSLHLFGRGKGILKPTDAPPFADWGIRPFVNAVCILCTSPRGTLDGLSIEAPRGKTNHQWTNGVGIRKGGLRLHSCACPQGVGKQCGAHWPTVRPSIVGCQLSGGWGTVNWSGGALGRLEGCRVSGGREVGLALWNLSTSPLISNNAFRGRLGRLNWSRRLAILEGYANV